MNIFPQIKNLTKYEGVNENTLTEILQTFQGKEPKPLHEQMK
jgi:hypothetical protein